MTAIALAQFECHQARARSAYLRFMTVGELLRRRGLSTIEISKAQSIRSEAFESLAESLGQLDALCTALYLDGIHEAKRERAPRYSSDARRQRPKL